MSALPCSNCLRRILSRPNRISRISPARLPSFQRHHATFLASTSSSRRAFHETSRALNTDRPDPTRHRRRDERPRSDETTQTDFGELDVLGNIPPPASSIESCMHNGFVLSNGVTIQNSGMLLVGGEVFRWKPWRREGFLPPPKELGIVNGMMHIDEESWGILDLIWPKPDLLVIGTGSSIKPLTKETRKIISNLGIRVEILDTRNAASQYNLLATERGVHEIAAAILPMGLDTYKGVLPA